MEYPKQIIHIETTPFPEAVLLAKAPTFKAAANFKDPVKIAEDISKKKAKYLEEAQFSVAGAYVSAVALRSEDGESQVFSTQCDDTSTEKELLAKLYGTLSSGWGTVSFRGAKHVYPFLAKRGALYAIPFFNLFYYNDSPGKLDERVHRDIAKIWACGSLSVPESLSEITSVLELDYEEPSVPYHVLAKDNPEMANTCLQQVAETIQKVYLLIK